MMPSELQGVEPGELLPSLMFAHHITQLSELLTCCACLGIVGDTLTPLPPFSRAVYERHVMGLLFERLTSAVSLTRVPDICRIDWFTHEDFRVWYKNAATRRGKLRVRLGRQGQLMTFPSGCPAHLADAVQEAIQHACRGQRSGAHHVRILPRMCHFACPAGGVSGVACSACAPLHPYANDSSTNTSWTTP